MDNEKQLLRQAKEGDVDAFATLFEELRPLCYSVAYRIVGPDDAEDVVMNSYLKAWKALPNFDERASLRTWLYRITHNAGLDWLRARKRRTDRIMPQDDADSRQISDLADESLPGQVEQIGGAEEKKLLAKAVGELDEIHRQAVLLHYSDGLSCAEVAAATGVSTGTVLSRLFNARKKLRAMLSDWERG